MNHLSAVQCDHARGADDGRTMRVTPGVDIVERRAGGLVETQQLPVSLSTRGNRTPTPPWRSANDVMIAVTVPVGKDAYYITAASALR
jgi:hypothetical protein